MTVSNGRTRSPSRRPSKTGVGRLSDLHRSLETQRDCGTPASRVPWSARGLAARSRRRPPCGRGLHVQVASILRSLGYLGHRERQGVEGVGGWRRRSRRSGRRGPRRHRSSWLPDPQLVAEETVNAAEHDWTGRETTKTLSFEDPVEHRRTPPNRVRAPQSRRSAEWGCNQPAAPSAAGARPMMTPKQTERRDRCGLPGDAEGRCCGGR